MHFCNFLCNLLLLSFLEFRTDFFLLQEHPTQAYGFPENVAKQIILRVKKLNRHAANQRNLHDNFRKFILFQNFQKYDSIPKEALKKNFENSMFSLLCWLVKDRLGFVFVFVLFFLEEKVLKNPQASNDRSKPLETASKAQK